MRYVMLVFFALSVGFVISFTTEYYPFDWQFWAATAPILFFGVLYANTDRFPTRR